MPRFFIDPPVGERALVCGEDAAHIACALRMRPGEELVLCDGQGSDYRCVIAEATPRQAALRVLGRCPSPGEPAYRATLYQCFCKGDKMEHIVQKAVELGAAEIVPVLSARCVARPDPGGFEKRRARLARVALGAAKQCGRGVVPRVGELTTLSALPGALAGHDTALFFYEQAQEKLSNVSLAGAGRIALVVGAEGGFSPQEAALLRGAGARALSLGRRILRCETAGPAALAALAYALGEM